MFKRQKKFFDPVSIFFLFPFFLFAVYSSGWSFQWIGPPTPLPKISTVLLLSHTQTQIHHGCGNHHKHSRNGCPHLTPFCNPGCPIFYCNFPITRRYWSHLSEWNLIDSWVICHLISVSQSAGPIPSLFSQSVSAAVSVRVFWKKLSFKKE